MRAHNVAQEIHSKWGVMIQPSQIRLWEKCGFLEPIKRTDSGHRNYSEADVLTIEKIVWAKFMAGMPNYKVKDFISGDEIAKEEVKNKIFEKVTIIYPKILEILNGKENK